MRIAVWSGPRNLSTAMMYAFAARPDCAVWDEPFYAAYLSKTGLSHPLRDEILAAGLTDPAAVIARCLGNVPEGKRVFYQKHMAQHMIEGIDRSWIAQCRNVFLIRDPARVIASYAAKRQNPSLADIGFCQQAELFDQVCQRDGRAPPVLDSVEIRKDPATQLQKLCSALGLDYTPAMLHWPRGGHRNDGVWARHWYGAVWNSTGFAKPEGPLPKLPPELQKVCDAARPYYDRMAAFRLR